MNSSDVYLNIDDVIDICISKKSIDALDNTASNIPQYTYTSSLEVSRIEYIKNLQHSFSKVLLNVFRNYDYSFRIFIHEILFKDHVYIQIDPVKASHKHVDKVNEMFTTGMMYNVAEFLYTSGGQLLDSYKEYCASKNVKIIRIPKIVTLDISDRFIFASEGRTDLYIADTHAALSLIPALLDTEYQLFITNDDYVKDQLSKPNISEKFATLTYFYQYPMNIGINITKALTKDISYYVDDIDDKGYVCKKIKIAFSPYMDMDSDLYFKSQKHAAGVYISVLAEHLYKRMVKLDVANVPAVGEDVDEKILESVLTAAFELYSAISKYLKNKYTVSVNFIEQIAPFMSMFYENNMNDYLLKDKINAEVIYQKMHNKLIVVENNITTYISWKEFYQDMLTNIIPMINTYSANNVKVVIDTSAGTALSLSELGEMIYNGMNLSKNCRIFDYIPNMSASRFAKYYHPETGLFMFGVDKVEDIKTIVDDMFI